MKLAPLVCCCLIVSIPLSSWPQSQPTLPIGVQGGQKEVAQEERSKKVKSEVQKRGTGEKATVAVTLRDKNEVKGYISQIDADSFQVTDKKTTKVSTINYDAVDRVRGGGLSRTAKIAIWVGVGAAVAIGLGLMAYTLNHS